MVSGATGMTERLNLTMVMCPHLIIRRIFFYQEMFEFASCMALQGIAITSVVYFCSFCAFVLECSVICNKTTS